MKKLVLAALALLVGSAAHAAAPNASFVKGRADLNAATHTHIAKPAYNTPITEPDFGTKMTRVGGNDGVQLPGFGLDGVGVDSVWGVDARHHYSKDPAFNSSGSLIFIENGRNGDDPGYGPESHVRKLILNGTTYAPDAVKSRYAAFRDSMTEMRWHPSWSNVAYFQYSSSKAPAGTTKIVMFDFARNVILKSWIIPGIYTWRSEGNITDDGRFTAMSTIPVLAEDNVSVLVLDFYKGTAGYDSAGTAHAGLGAWDTTTVTPFPLITGPQLIDHVNISLLGNYVVFKYNSGGNTTRLPQDQQRILVRSPVKDATAPDTSSRKLFPLIMPLGAIRFAVACSIGARDGWTYPLSHGSMNLDENGVEVMVGGGRGKSYCNNFSAVRHSDAERDSGNLVMVRMSDGTHHHVSAGGLTGLGGASESGIEHTSGTAKQLRGWALVSYENGVPTNRFDNEAVWWKLSTTPGVNSAWRIGSLRTATPTSGTPPAGCTVGCGPNASSEGCYRDEAQPCASNDGLRTIFASNWIWYNAGSGGACHEAKGYVIDSRAEAPRNFWVAPSGTDVTTAGWSPSNPWRTIGYAAGQLPAPSTALGGDVVVNVATGTYTDTPAGYLTPLNGYRYVWIGNTTTPTQVALTSLANINSSYLTIKGFDFRAGLRTGAVRRDSVTDSKVTGFFDINGSEDCMFSRITHTGRKLRLGVFGGKRRTVRDTLSEITSTLTAPTSDVTSEALFQLGATSTDAALRYTVDSCLIERSRIMAYMNAPLTYTSPGVRMYHTRNTVSRYNRYYIRGTLANPVALAISDSSGPVTFNGDSLIAHGEAADLIFDAGAGVVTGIAIDSTYASVSSGTAALFAAVATNASLTYSTFVSGTGRALHCYGLSGSTIDHNTFAGGNARGGVVRLHGSTFSTTDTTKFYSNIVAPLGLQGDLPPMSATNDQCGMFVDKAITGSAFKSNWNLYPVFGYHAFQKDAALGWCCAYGSGPPGVNDGSAWKATWPANRRGDADSLSIYGGAEFGYGASDSLFRQFPSGTDSIFNSTPGPLSGAIAVGKSGTDAGAVRALRLPVVQLSSVEVRFFPTQTGVQLTGSLLITNAGGTNLVLSNLRDASSEVGESLSATTIAADATATLTVTLTPTVLTGRIFTVYFDTNDPNQPTVGVTVHQNTGSDGGGAGPLQYPTGDEK